MMTRRRRAGQIVVGLLLAAGLPFGGVYRLRVLDQHERAFIRAVKQGNREQMTAELRWGVDPNTRDMPSAPTDWRTYLHGLFQRKSLHLREQYTPALLLAIANKDVETERLLLRAGADPNATDNTNTYALITAIAERNADMALLLLAKGADPNTTDAGAKSTALLNALEVCGYDPDMKNVARDLIQRGAKVRVKDGAGETPLLHASQSIMLTELLLARGADVNAADSNGLTPLMRANAEVAAWLLQHGANPNARNKWGETTLAYIAESNDDGIVRLLLQYGADCSLAHNNVWNLLCWSARENKPEIARFALSHDVGVNSRDGFGRTPLMFAVSRNHPALLNMLLARGADVNAQDNAGMTALMYAAQQNNADMVRRLLWCGANSRLRDRLPGWTAAERARHYLCENTADLLRAVFMPPPNAANAKADSIRVDANRRLVRAPVATGNNPDTDMAAAGAGYFVRLVDNAGHEGAAEVVDTGSQPPTMFVFHDTDGRSYACVENDSYHHGYKIYLVRGLQLTCQWAEANRFGMECTPLRQGGALIRMYEPGYHGYGWHSPQTYDVLTTLYRFHRGGVKELSTVDSP